jgi:hypothetical protein
MPFIGRQSCGSGNRLEEPKELRPVQFPSLLAGEQEVGAISWPHLEPSTERGKLIKQWLPTVWE